MPKPPTASILRVMLAAPSHLQSGAGLPALGELPWGAHVCHLYESADALAEVVVAFIREGLEAGEQCLWIACAPLPKEEARRALAEVVPNLEAYEASGQLELLSHDDWYLRAGGLDAEGVVSAWLTREELAQAKGFSGLRITGNVAWLDRGAWKDFCDYEARVQSAFRGRRIRALCSYPLEGRDSSELVDVALSHDVSLTRHRGQWRALRGATALLEAADPVPPDSGITLGKDDLSPPPRGGAHSGHDVRFFEPDRFPTAAIASYLVEAVEGGGAALAVVSREWLPTLEMALAAYPAAVHALRERRLIFLEAEAVSASLHDGAAIARGRVEEVIVPLLDELSAAGRSLRVFGMIVDVLCHEGRPDEAIQLEGWWNELRERYPFELLCGYRLSSFDDAASLDAFRGVCDAHGEVQSAVAADGLDAERLLAHYEQRSRALAAEVSRSRDLERQRDQLVASASTAAREASTTRTHLARLQQVSAALCEATTLADLERLLEGPIRRSLEARRVSLLLLGDGDDAGTAPSSEIARAAETARTISYEASGRCAVALPLVLGPRRLGAVAIESETQSLSVADRALYEDVARQLALALDRALTLAAVERAREVAERANRAKDEFLAMLGHELRNPLSPILTAVQLMDRLGDTAKRERTVIARQVSHMARLVDDLLDIGRITSGRLELSRALLEISDVVDAAIEMASPLIEARSHHLEVEVAQLRLEGDRHRLTQAIANLLTNAAKYSPSRSTIRLSAREQRGRLVLSVTDDGDGLAPELIPTLFEPFTQGSQSIDRSRGGLGVGLAIVRTIVDLHQGSVRAESDGPGTGSTFTIELPLAQGLAEVATPSQEEAAQSEGRIHILVVDDNRDAADLLAELLRHDGNRVEVAHDGPAALDRLQGFTPDLALLDIGLPVMDGYELAHHLRERLGERCPQLVAITGYGQPSDRERTTAAGFDEHLVKPVDLGRLIAIARTVEESIER